MSDSTQSTTARGSSRREFLKRSAAAALAGATAGMTITRGAHAAGSETLKVGLVGCGGRGSGAAMDALGADPGTKLVAMADIFEDKVRGSRDRLAQLKPDQVAVDDDRCFVGFDGYQKVIQSGVDVVLIACASRFHPKYLEAAVRAGKHVFVEKPHGVDPPGVRRVMAACEEAEKKGLSVVSGLCWRYHTGVQETMKRVLDGAIGDVVAIQETYMRGPYRLVARQPGQGEIEYQYRNWYHFNWLSGDDIAQSLIHSIDKGAWALREEPPVAAYGLGGRAASFDPIYGDVFDHNAIVYEYANGARLYAVGRAQKACYNEVSDFILGTKGRANVLQFAIEGETNWKYDGPECRMYSAEHEALFASIRKKEPLNNGTRMARSTMLVVLGQMASYTGKKIAWDDAMAADYTLGPEDPDFSTDPPVKPDEDGLYPVAIPGLSTMG